MKFEKQFLSNHKIYKAAGREENFLTLYNRVLEAEFHESHDKTVIRSRTDQATDSIEETSCLIFADSTMNARHNVVLTCDLKYLDSSS